MIKKLASAIYNDIYSGLIGITSNPTLSMDQLEDEVVEEWLQVIKEYSLKNILPLKDLLISINCIDVDCLALDKCPICSESNPYSIPEYHFQIPQTINDLAEEAIFYIGATDKSLKYKIYTNPQSLKYHKYNRRGSDKPYVYIDTTPNENNMYDGWIFNSPLIQKISFIGIIKDLRQLDNYECCSPETLENLTFIVTELKKRLIEKKIRYYRQLYIGSQPNNQVAK